MQAAGFFTKHKQIIIYGVCLAFLLLFLNWIKLKFLIFDNAIELYTGLIALFFTALGIWLALKLVSRKKEIIIKEAANFQFNQQALEAMRISKRELEVLELMAQGLSNIEIAEKLFVSVNTIKTHSSKLFEKMEVSSRTKAIEMGKRIRLIP